MKKTILVLSCILAGSHLYAGAAADQKKVAEWMSSYSENNSDFKARCGVAITTNMDSKAFLSSEFVAKDTNPGSYCKVAVSGLASKCEDATFKAEIAKKIKKVNCAPGKGSEQSLSLSGDTLTYKVSPGASNQDTFVEKWLGDNL